MHEALLKMEEKDTEKKAKSLCFSLSFSVSVDTVR